MLAGDGERISPNVASCRGDKEEGDEEEEEGVNTGDRFVSRLLKREPTNGAVTTEPSFSQLNLTRDVPESFMSAQTFLVQLSLPPPPPFPPPPF